MGNQTGAASGSAAAKPTTQQAVAAGGGAIAGAGKSGMDQTEQLLANLAKMGPPPTIPLSQGPTPQAGQALVGQYKQKMAPPAYRSRMDNQMNPSVGQMLVGA